MRYRVNLSFDGYKHREVVTGDPTACARYVEQGWLTPLGDDGLPSIPLEDHAEAWERFDPDADLAPGYPVEG